MRKLKIADYIIIALNLCFIAFFSIAVYSHNYSETLVKIESGGEEWVYPIDEDRIVNVKGPLGYTIVEIENGRVRFKDSPCPDKICMFRGWMSNPLDWAACLPNGVIISIEGNEENNGDAFN